jgi:hypothetical protein
MGYIDENGEYQFESGFGKGVAGGPYRKDSPQGEFGYLSSGQKTLRGGVLPYWATAKDRREHVLLVFFERRANKSLKVPPGDFSTRLETVTAQLEAARQVEMRRIHAQLEYETKYNWRAHNRLAFLKNTGEYTAWATAVLTDYFFAAADCPEGEYVQSWDAGQCARRNGEVKKIFVKQLIRKVDKIGRELYPAPKG